MARLTLRVDLDGAGSVGPGKIRLLESISEHGSIRGGAGALKMSYKRAWGLVQELETIFGAPVLETETGGRAGGGARLSPLGCAVVKQYRTAEREAARAAQQSMGKLERLVVKST